MAYLRQLKNSPYWVACWTGKGGAKRNRSTKVRIVPEKVGRLKAESPAQAKARAQMVADAFEVAETDGDASKVKAVLSLLAGDSDESIAKAPLLSARLDEWVTRRRASHPRTVNSDARAIEKLLAATPPELRLDEFTHSMAQDFITRQLERVSVGTADRYRQSFSTAWNEAINDEIILRNPWRGLKMPSKSSQDKIGREAFTASDVRVLLDQLPPVWQSMVRVSLYLGGQRLSDCALLKWNAVDFQGGSVAIVTQKTGREMVIPMISPLEQHLRAWREAHLDDEYVHQDLAERVIRNDNTTHISSEFANLVELLGLSKREQLRAGERKSYRSKTFHSLRSMAVTMLHQAGVPVSMAMMIVGHNNAEIHRVYYRPSHDDIRRSMRNLNVEGEKDCSDFGDS